MGNKCSKNGETKMKANKNLKIKGEVFISSPHLAYLAHCVSQDKPIEDLLRQFEPTEVEVFLDEGKSLFPDICKNDFTGNIAEDLKILVRKINTAEVKIMVEAVDLHSVEDWFISKQNQTPEHRIKDIKCVLKTPPTRARTSHKQILSRIEMERIRIQNGDEGPIVVTSLMNSRDDTDIERDMKKVNVSDEDCKRVILMRIVPVNNPNSYQEPDKQERFKLDLTFLVDVLDLTLLECEHNNQAVAQFVTYVNK